MMGRFGELETGLSILQKNLKVDLHVRVGEEYWPHQAINSVQIRWNSQVSLCLFREYGRL